MLKKLYHKIWEIAGKFFKEGVELGDENLIATTNLFYGEDEKNNSFDVFYPKVKQEKMPTIIFFHGGGYISGQKEGTRNFCKLMGEKGFLVFNVEYTKCGKEEKKFFPTPIYEFYNFYKHISECSVFSDLIDYDNIFLSGDSAGAHIAALVANIQTNQELKMEFNLCGGPKVKGLILMSPCFGVYNFKGLFPKKQYHDVIFGNKKIRNPLCGYTHNLDILTEGFPPTLMISVKTDLVVGVHKRIFLKMAEELGLSVKHYELYSGYKLFHSSMINYAEKYPHCFEKIEEFVLDSCKNNFVDGVRKDILIEEIVEDSKKNVQVERFEQTDCFDKIEYSEESEEVKEASLVI